MNIKQLIPMLDWLPKYKGAQFKGDLSAGLTVGVMLIPQGMAYAMIAGLPPQYGLYASMLPLVIYAIFGTSRQLAVGPSALVSLLTVAGIGSMAELGSEQYIALAIALALFVGLIQFALGVFRLGFLVNFLSHPVIIGFTAAAALVIGLSQLKHLLGFSIPRGLKVHEIILTAINNFSNTHWATFGIGVGGIAIILLAKKINKAIPGPLLAVTFGIIIVSIFNLGNEGVKIVREIPNSIPSLRAPIFDTETIHLLFPVALAIALVSFMESIAIAKAVHAKHKDYKIDSNQELLALGVANIIGSFSLSYPTTGGFSRTAVNDQAGAKTGIAAIISAFLVLLTLLFFTPVFYNLPKAILGSIIMVSAFSLIDTKEIKHLWASNKTDFSMFLVTFFATLILGVEEGIGLGVILSLAMVIFKTTRPHVAVLGNVPNTHFYRNIERFNNLEIKDEILIVRFDAQLYFANANYFKEKIESLVEEKGKQLKLIIINAESINNLDSSAVHALSEVVEDLNKDHIEIAFTGVKGPVRDAMVRGHILDVIKDDHFFMSVQEAVDCYELKCYHPDSKKTQNLDDYTLQTNA